MRVKSERNIPKELVLVVLVLGLIGLAVWQVFGANFKQTAAASPTPNRNPSPIHAGTAQVQLPQGWSSLDKSKFLSGVQYQIGFQQTSTDYLKLAYGKNATLVRQVTTQKGTPAYILKDHDYAMVSACPVGTDGRGCSFQADGKYLLILLHGYRPGEEHVRGLDFPNANPKDIATLLNDLAKVAESLNL